MGLVKTILGKHRHQVKELFRQGCAIAFLLRTRQKCPFVLGHFFGLFLTHRSPEQIGTTEGVAPNGLRNLHDLLLVDDHAVGRFESRLEVRMEEVNGLLPFFAQDEIVDHARTQWTGTIQREDRDDVLKAIWLKLFQELFHAVAFKLENRGGIRDFENLISLGVIKRQAREVQAIAKRNACPLLRLPNVADRQIQNGQVAQPKEVKLHQAHRFDIVFVVLTDHGIRAGRFVERTKIRQTPRRNQHPTCMHADVAGQVFKRAGDFKQAADVIFFFFPLTQLRLGLARLNERERFILDDRDQLRQLITKIIRKIEYPARIADDGLRGHRAKRCDLANGLCTVLLAHILDHTPALVLTKINIKIGH